MSLPSSDSNVEATSSGRKKDMHQIIKGNKYFIHIKNTLNPGDTRVVPLPLKTNMFPGLFLINNTRIKL